MTARYRIEGFVLLFVLLFFPLTLLSQNRIRVDETKTRLTKTRSGPFLRLAIANDYAPEVPVQVQLEVLGTSDEIIETVSRDLIVKGRSRQFDIPLLESSVRVDDTNNGFWRRLRYRVTVRESGHTVPAATGVIALSELNSDPFIVRVATAPEVFGGRKTRVHVFTSHPTSHRPLGNVAVTATLTISDDNADRVLKATGRTNGSGHTALDFDIPGGLEYPDLDLHIKAVMGNITKEVIENLSYHNGSDIILSTDKPIYQPGQRLRVRLLGFNSSKRALAKVPMSVSIYDPESSRIYQADIVTSEFGEANTEWEIPDNIRLGDYRVEVGRTGEFRIALKQVKISRYDLPGFTIAPTPDRKFYLPNQNAQVEIRADYLFGQPVKQGRVRVVRENLRRWDFRSQQWKVDESEVAKGDLDPTGRFRAAIDLEEDHDRLAASTYQRYSDLRYAAYVTDTTTNRTEQRRFDLRLSREPIHVYVGAGANAKEFPLEFYVSTFYADGRPAKASVRIYELPPNSPRISTFATDTGVSLVRTIRTNSYGVAKVSQLRTESDGLMLVAEDGMGALGRSSHFFYLNDTALRISTDKTLYRPGEQIKADFRSTLDSGPVIVDVSRENKVLYSTVVRLQKGKAFTVIPYLDTFQDDITISAISAKPGADRFQGALTIAYPRDRELRVDARFDKQVYEPGTEASVAFRVRTPDGAGKRSLLGVVVLDKAVEERARTDNEFGRGYWFCEACLGWRRGEEELAGLTRRDLDRIDLSQPVPEELSLAAELLLNSNPAFSYTSWVSDDGELDPLDAFKRVIENQLGSFRRTLDWQAGEGRHPVDESSLRELLATGGLNFESVRDPWDNAYRASFGIESAHDVMTMSSAGPDKQFGTPDDFTVLRMTWNYFERHGLVLNKAVAGYFERTGDFIRDMTTLRAELRNHDEDPDSWRDRWDQPYRLEFEVIRTHFNITVRSGGPNRGFESDSVGETDDIVVWNASVDYTPPIRKTLDRIVESFYRETKTFPETASQFAEAVQRGGAPESSLSDPWMRPLYPTFKSEYYFADRLNVISYAQYLRRNAQLLRVPVTRKIQFIVLRSVGLDGIEGSSDDFDVASVSRTSAEQSADQATPATELNAPVLEGANGAIQGTVTDATLARIPGVSVQAKSLARVTFKTVSNENGEYILRNLPRGLYELSFELPGFQTTTIRDVPVRPAASTEVFGVLEVGQIAQSVEVSLAAEPGVLATTSSSVSVQSLIEQGPGSTLANSLSTPRLREYFPETLLWQPALETDRSGRAQARFKIADSLTTWKMAVVVSTIEGDVSVVEKEVVSFQPFFVEHDPPKILTQGDEIHLPVVVRSYLDQQQPVELAIKGESWFAPIGDTTRKTSVNAGGTIRETFAFKALTPVTDAPQRITARGNRAGDSIEKPVSVHPDGQEMVRVFSEILRDTAAHTINVPADAIPGTMRSQVRIYPNLMAHVVDGIEGVLQRPYGCAEQTISSGYPSLLLLRHYSETGGGPSPLTAKAGRYLQSALDRLRAYQTADGGFSYWGHGEPDVAVTAYAIRFLHDAADVVSVDEKLGLRAYEWLLRQQAEDGSWPVQSGPEDYRKARTLNLTALVARSLSLPRLREANRLRGRGALKPRDSVLNAIEYLRNQIESSEEPYALASMAIAASNVGNRDILNDAVARLERIARKERSGTYWDLQTNTPFYGWGLPGRIETTALAVHALAGSGRSGSLVDQGLLFLLRNKDRYGVWFSTQATVNALEALMRFVGSAGPNTAATSGEILVNARVVRSITIPAGNQSNRIDLDLSQFLEPGTNQIEIRGVGTAAATVQFVETYYVPWSDDKPHADGDLRLSVRYDQTTGQTGDDIVCTVKAERVGFRGYGMMLAEIGLPPGAEVDRASLEEAVRSGRWDLYRYDVLPDRVIAYIWPRAGGSQFDFKFRLRYGIKAQTSASRLYDYYNPDAEVVTRPVRFEITELRK